MPQVMAQISAAIMEVTMVSNTLPSQVEPVAVDAPQFLQKVSPSNTWLPQFLQKAMLFTSFSLMSLSYHPCQKMSMR
jgi:hypothetical protein